MSGGRLIPIGRPLPKLVGWRPKAQKFKPALLFSKAQKSKSDIRLKSPKKEYERATGPFFTPGLQRAENDKFSLCREIAPGACNSGFAARSISSRVFFCLFSLVNQSKRGAGEYGGGVLFCGPLTAVRRFFSVAFSRPFSREKIFATQFRYRPAPKIRGFACAVFRPAKN